MSILTNFLLVSIILHLGLLGLQLAGKNNLLQHLVAWIQLSLAYSSANKWRTINFGFLRLLNVSTYVGFVTSGLTNLRQHLSLVQLLLQQIDAQVALHQIGLIQRISLTHKPWRGRNSFSLKSLLFLVLHVGCRNLELTHERLYFWRIWVERLVFCQVIILTHTSIGFSYKLVLILALRSCSTAMLMISARTTCIICLIHIEKFNGISRIIGFQVSLKSLFNYSNRILVFCHILKWRLRIRKSSIRWCHFSIWIIHGTVRPHLVMASLRLCLTIRLHYKWLNYFYYLFPPGF